MFAYAAIRNFQQRKRKFLRFVCRLVAFAFFLRFVASFSVPCLPSSWQISCGIFFFSSFALLFTCASFKLINDFQVTTRAQECRASWTNASAKREKKSQHWKILIFRLFLARLIDVRIANKFPSTSLFHDFFYSLTYCHFSEEEKKIVANELFWLKENKTKIVGKTTFGE